MTQDPIGVAEELYAGFASARGGTSPSGLEFVWSF